MGIQCHSIYKDSYLLIHARLVHGQDINIFMLHERKSEQAHIPHAPTLLEKAVCNEWQFQALGTGNRTKKGI